MRRRMLFSGESGEPINVNEYCTVKALEDGLTVTWTSTNNNVVLYCVNGNGVWRELNSGETTTAINTNSTLSFKIDNSKLIAIIQSLDSDGVGNLQANEKSFNLIGNVMSMITPSDLANKNLSSSSYCFCRLFSGAGNRQLNKIVNGFLPATTLSEGCYAYMFADRRKVDDYWFTYSNMTVIDGDGRYVNGFLPATTLADYCYYGMFSGSAWSNIPELPVTTLADYCYAYMFSDTEIYGGSSHEFNYSESDMFKLPATELTPYCYAGMFSGASIRFKVSLPATSLSEGCYSRMFSETSTHLPPPSGNGYSVPVYPVDSLPATSLNYYCYSYMFNSQFAKYRVDDNDAYLKALPFTLPATWIPDYAYEGMFYDCDELEVAPALPAKTIGECSYSSMFAYCTSLTTAPDLPATSLLDSCYKEMFYGCTSLTTAPDLPATNLVDECYSGMFKNCSNLSSIRANFLSDPNDIWANNYVSFPKYTEDWVSGVASTGTFAKNASATWSLTGPNGVPSGWTITTY